MPHAMRIYNTLGRELQELAPSGGTIGMYVCGPTVQSAPHLGHGRAAVAFDVIRRYLVWRGFDVTYVMNITDVDDKIIAAGNRLGISPDEVAAEATDKFLSGYRALNVLEPDVMPRATDHIPEMIHLVERLIEAGHAYEADGDVYFSVASFGDYGKLSGRDSDDVLVGARVEPGEAKRDALDFALWKAAKPDEPQWESPWGPGRPGWHIECSAMSEKYLGFGFAIHGGGQDLIFPHHENEIAQSEAAAGSAPFARYWLHNGFVNLSGEKMSKSTGRLIDLLTAVEEFPPLAVRLFYLRTHYRSPVDFSEEAIDDAVATLERLWSFRRRVPGAADAQPDPTIVSAFSAAMDDDFNTAEALAVIFEAVREGNRRLDDGEDAGPYVAAYDELMGVFGLCEPEKGLDDISDEVSGLAARFGVPVGTDAEATVTALVGHRQDARAAGDWDTADGIRDAMAELGIVVEDTADGVRWYRR